MVYRRYKKKYLTRFGQCECKDHKANPIQSKQDRNLIGFVKRFGSNLRAILTKEKEGYFIVLFLDKHKYYEIEMLKLGF